MERQSNLIYPSDRTIAPQIAPSGERFDEWITTDSPEFQKVAVGRLQRFMNQETRCGCESLDVVTWESSFEVLSLTTDMFESREAAEESNFLVGFVWMILEENIIPNLYNCYLHPSFRGEQGRHNLMFKGWQKIIERFPKFEVEMPVSGAMKAFLNKIDVDTSGVSNIDLIFQKENRAD